MVATGLATESHRPAARGAPALRGPDARAGLLDRAVAAAAAVELVALASIVFADEPVPG